ncbi:MAG: hypothetical protein GC150_06530 [Rhizobiales bacterium]|nr:hypothetical protein [Hyphomicrobiales bacterium]
MTTEDADGRPIPPGEEPAGPGETTALESRLQTAFRWIWRFNALAIAGVAVIAGLLGLIALAAVGYDFLRIRHVEAVARVDPTGTRAPRLELNNFTEIGRTDLFWAARSLVQHEERYASGGKSAWSVRNYVFYDPATGATHELLADDTALVLSATHHYLPGDEAREQPVAILVRLVRRDTNGDGYLSESDVAELAIASPDGRRIVELAIPHDDLKGTATRADGTILAFIEAPDGTHEALHLDGRQLAIAERHRIEEAAAKVGH